MSAVKDPVYDPIARSVSRDDFNDLSTASRIEIVKIAEMRKQTKAIEAQTKTLEHILSHFIESALAPKR